MQCVTSAQTFGMVRFIFFYAVPVTIFAYCYGRIFHTIKRQNKVISGHVVRNHDAAMANTTRDPNAGRIQQQVIGAKLSRTELNVLQTMISVIACFMMLWTVPAFANLLQLLGVSMTVKV